MTEVVLKVRMVGVGWRNRRQTPMECCRDEADDETKKPSPHDISRPMNTQEDAGPPDEQRPDGKEAPVPAPGAGCLCFAKDEDVRGKKHR